MEFDYSKLKGLIKEKFGTQAAFAEALGVSNTTMSQRLNGVNEFTQSEIARACDILEIPAWYAYRYFFMKKI